MIYIWYNIALGRYFSGVQSAFSEAQSHFGAPQLLVLHKFNTEGLTMAQKITDRLNMRAIHNHSK